MLKFDTGDIKTTRNLYFVDVKGTPKSHLLDEGHLIIELMFQQNKEITETWVADIAKSNAMMMKRHQELRDTIKLLRMFVYQTLDKPQEIADLPVYDKDCDSSLKSLHDVILEQREQFQELFMELKHCEYELSKIDSDNPCFEEKYPELIELERLEKYTYVPESFYGMNSINQIRKAVLEEIEKYQRLEEELKSLDN